MIDNRVKFARSCCSLNAVKVEVGLVPLIHGLNGWSDLVGLGVLIPVEIVSIKGLRLKAVEVLESRIVSKLGVSQFARRVVAAVGHLAHVLEHASPNRVKARTSIRPTIARVGTLTRVGTPAGRGGLANCVV